MRAHWSRVWPALLLPAVVTAAATAQQPAGPGTMRQLVCRGVAGIRLTVQADPSPRDPRQVAVSLAYQRNTKDLNGAYDRLDPGTCTWNPYGYDGVPEEPGVVRFDLVRTGSAEVPDPRTLPLYLGDPQHYWLFYVDDVTHLSISHGAHGGRFRVEDQLRDQRPQSAGTAFRREELRCRGGPGLAFTRGAAVGANQSGMTLAYRVAFSAAGPLGRGLEPGTCAWADRTDAREEPGRITFVTAGNAQLRQVQGGAAVDRSPTAAERWPDVHSIPAYLTDAAHFWTFTVSLANPDSALGHRAWKPATGGLVSSRPPSDSRTRVSLPGGSTAGERYKPGSGAAATDPRRVFDIRNVQVTAGLEGVVIRFEAGPGLRPTVVLGNAPPVGAAGSHRFEGQAVPLTVQGTATGGTHWRYVAASSAPLARDTTFWFIATAPEGPNSRQNQATGSFRTLKQRLIVTVNEITVLSDGDSDSDGEFFFGLRSCPDGPRGLYGELVGDLSNRVQWSEGRHRVGVVDTSGAWSVPDRISLLFVGVEDDHDVGGQPYQDAFQIRCGGSPPFIEPGRTGRDEWNAAVLDLDLTKLPGAKATLPFVRRSMPLRNGSTVMFEVHGFVTAIRE